MATAYAVKKSVDADCRIITKKLHKFNFTTLIVKQQSLLFSKSKNTSSLSDEALLQEYKRTGNNRVLGDLFKRYAHLVFGVCMKYFKNADDAQDVTMQVFEKLLTGLRNYEVNHFKSWLYRVAKNECLMHLRKSKKHIQVELNKNEKDNGEHSVETELAEHPDNNDFKELQLQLLEKGITQLNGEQKICVELFYLQNKSYTEVADITGYNLKQVKSYIQNGKRNLKIYLLNNNVE